MLVMDSGLGGLSVVRALRAANPALTLRYVADTAGFPYGKLAAETIAERASNLIKMLGSEEHLDTVVLACNTLSTLCLTQLRASFDLAFVGTVPAIKVAAQQSQTKRFTLLATPNTAHSRYTDNLIAEFAGNCTVDVAPAPNLAAYAERMLLGETIDADALRSELAPVFHDGVEGRTDAVVLGCTHYPLILDALKAVAPWEVTWIDSGAAIARRALELADAAPNASVAYVTSHADVERYRAVFLNEGFSDVRAITLS